MIRILLLITLFFLGHCKEKKNDNDSVGSYSKTVSGLTLFVVGDVKKNANPIKLGENVSASENIIVGKQSCVDFQILNLAEEIVIRLKENTKFQLKERLEDTSLKKLYVLSGDAVFNIKKIKQDESLQIITPTMAVAVRGTQFGISIDSKSGTSSLELYNGSVSVTPSLQELDELGEEVLKAVGINNRIEDWKKRSEIILEPGQSLESNPKVTQELLNKIGWEELKSKPEVKEFLNKKANSTLTEEDKNKIKFTLKSYYEDPKNKERVNSALNEKISFPTKLISSTELNSKVEELKELVAIEKGKLEKSSDPSLPIKERTKVIRDQLMKRIAEITQDDIRTIRLKNGQTLRGSCKPYG